MADSISPLQEDFSAGELSPRFLARITDDMYNRGVRVMFNMLPLVQGPVTRRPGTQFLVELLDGEEEPVTNARLFNIHTTDEEVMLLVMAGGIGRLFSVNDFAITSNILLNNDFSNGLESWLFSSVSGGRIEWSPINGGRANLIGPGSLSQIADIVLPNDTFTVSYAITREGDSLGSVLVLAGTTGGSPETLYEAFHILSGIDPNGTLERDVTVPLPFPGFTGELEIVFIQSNPLVGGTALSFIEHAGLIVTTGAASGSIEFPIPYADEELDVIQYISSPYEILTAFTHPAHPPQELIFTTVWEFQEMEFTNNPATWTPETGYPRTCGGFQGKLYLGGWTAEPHRVIATVTGDWHEFKEPGADPSPTDSLDFTLTAVGTIQWIEGGRELLLGTQNGEHLLTSTSGIIQSSDLDARQQSAYGSKYRQPVDVGDQLLYISADGRKVRAMEFNRDLQAWRSRDMTHFSEHITLSGIHRMTYSRDPSQVIWAVLNNGGLIGMSYERSMDIFGWHRHGTSGAFIDVATLRLAGRDIPVFIVRRTIGGVNRFYLESLSTVDVLENDIYMDSFLIETYVEPTSILTGLEHLEGQKVQVLGDSDDFVGNYEVVGGEVDISPIAVTRSVVGTPIPCQLKTMPMSSLSRYGSNMNALKSRPEISLRLLESATPLINGSRPAERHPESPMNRSQPLFSGEIKQLNLGVDADAEVDITQDIPRRLTVLGIFGRAGLEDL